MGEDWNQDCSPSSPGPHLRQPLPKSLTLPLAVFICKASASQMMLPAGERSVLCSFRYVRFLFFFFGLQTGVQVTAEPQCCTLPSYYRAEKKARVWAPFPRLSKCFWSEHSKRGVSPSERSAGLERKRVTRQPLPPRAGSTRCQSDSVSVKTWFEDFPTPPIAQAGTGDPDHSFSEHCFLCFAGIGTLFLSSFFPEILSELACSVPFGVESQKQRAWTGGTRILGLMWYVN